MRRLTLIALLAACAAPQAPAPPSDDPMTRSVRLDVFCLRSQPFGDGPALRDDALAVGAAVGSGVITDDRHVLTAAHVVTCPVQAAIRGTLADGRQAQFDVVKIDTRNDLARLVLHANETAMNYRKLQPATKRPRIGDVVCTTPAYPLPAKKVCGVVDAFDASTVIYDILTQHGNSGGGIWIHDQLLGITTHMLNPTAGEDISLTGRGALINSGWL